MFKKYLFLWVVSLTSCMTVGPDYKDPNLKISKNWLYASKRNDASVSAAKLKHGNWWKLFNDKVLNKLILKGYNDNLTLQISGVGVLFSRANLALSIGEQFPQQQVLTGSSEYNYLGSSSNSYVASNSYRTHSLGFGSSWEVDFWGKYRRAVQSSDASFLASMAAYDNALVSLIANISNAYINIRTYEEKISVSKQNIAIQQESLLIAKSKYHSGETSRLDVEQAITLLGQTQAQLPIQVTNVQVQKNQLSLLLGMAPNQINPLLKGNKNIPLAPKKIEIPIPNEMLAQRPDVAEARLQAMASSAIIGATKAQLYPALSLMGTFTFSSNNKGNNSLANLFGWSSLSMNVGPSFNFPIFNYGQITNTVRMKDALFQEALLTYQNIVLTAQKEVQDAITQYVQLKKVIVILERTNRSAKAATRLSLVRYKNGETNYTSVLDALQIQLQVQSSLTQSKGDIALALTSLFRSLGGGWQLRAGHPVISSEIKHQMAKRTNWGSLLGKGPFKV